MQKPTASQWHELRQRLHTALPTDADFMAFVLDHFPDIARRFSAAMDLLAKENLLLELVPTEDVHAALSGQSMSRRWGLRAPVDSFVGRQLEVSNLVAQLQQAADGTSVCIRGIRGLGGIGKTELAIKVAASLREQFPVQFFVELRGQSKTPTPPEQALRQILQALFPRQRLPDRQDELVRLYGEALSGLRALVIADDALDAAQVIPLYPPAGCVLLITTRNLPALVKLGRKDVCNLGALPRQHSVQLLRDRCGRLSDSEADALAAHCGDLPKALHAVAGLLENDPTRRVQDYLRDLEERRCRLAHLRNPDDPDLDIEATLSLSYDALPSHAQDALRQLGVMPASFELAVAEAVVRLKTDTVASAIGTLYKRSLIEWTQENNRYHLHDLVRSLALGLLDDAETHAAQARHADYFSRKLREAGGRHRQGRDGVQAGLQWFDTEQEHLVAAHAWAMANAEHDKTAAARCIDLALRGPNVIDRRLPPELRIQWYQSAAVAARRLGKPADEGMALNNLGIAHAVLDEPDKALECYERSLSIARELGKSGREASILGNLGNAYKALGQLDKALTYYKQHLAMARETDSREGEGIALNNIGGIHRARGELADARVCFEERLAIARSLDDPYGEGIALYNLAELLWDQGHKEQARAKLRESLRIHEDLRDPWTEKVRQKCEVWEKS